MDTRQLKTLLAIQSHGTFAQAAEVVHLTPSAVSQQIHALEDELQVTLFDRGTRPPSITPDGLQVIEMARDILRREEDTKASLRGDQIAGTLMLGSVRSSALNLLPRALVQMRQRYPDLKPSLRVSLSSTLISDVAAGRLDAAIVAEHLGFPNALRWSPFLREPLWLIMPHGMESSDPIELLNTRPYIRFRSAVPLANLIDTEFPSRGRDKRRGRNRHHRIDRHLCSARPGDFGRTPCGPPGTRRYQYHPPSFRHPSGNSPDRHRRKNRIAASRNHLAATRRSRRTLR